jgi:cell division protein FtsW
MDKKLGNIFKGDKVIWMVFFFLCIISVVEVFSASSGLTYKSGSYLTPIIKHIFILSIGVFLMVVTLNIKCKYFKIATPILLVVSVLTLVWVYFAGQATNDAQRWISLLGMQFQPSEIAKGTMILATAQILSAMQTDNGADKHAMKYILIVCLFIIPLIMAENLSTAALLCAVIFFMMVIGRVPARQLGKLIGGVVMAVVVVVSMVMIFGKDTEEANPTRTSPSSWPRNKPRTRMAAAYSTGSTPGSRASTNSSTARRCHRRNSTSTKTDRWDMPTSP